MNPRKKWRNMPGTMEYTGDVDQPTSIRHIQYDKTRTFIHDSVEPLVPDLVDWIVVEGLTDVNKISALCESFAVDALVVEDILNVHQRTKAEHIDRYWFIVVRYPYLDGEVIAHDYASMLLFPNTLISFSESSNRFVDHMLERLEHPKTNLRKFGHDYLFYVLYDLIVDEAMQVSSHILDRIESLEDKLLDLNQADQLELYGLRKELVFLRSMTMQLLTNFPKESFVGNGFVQKNVQKYYDDVYDHLQALRNQVIITIEQVSHILDVYLNQVSNRMNQIMTTLTIFSAIFIPLSFLAGVFGMNFTNFPILTNPSGLWIFGIICVLLPVGMLWFFKARKWF